jgi:hypothetical protein
VPPASAQVWIDDAARPPAEATARLNRQGTLQIDPARSFGPAISLDAIRDIASAQTQTWTVSTRRDIWHEGSQVTDRLSLTTRGELRRADGSPLPVTPLEASALDIDEYDVRFVRGWPVARGYTASGLEVSLTPHAGIGVGTRGGSAEAGATLRIGGDLGKVVPEGSEAFGERARWYVYAAGSGTAVGYNFARNRDGDFARSGVSHDSGSFLGDASIGVALRKGDMQGSFGIVYREVEAEGLRGGEGFDRDVTEGLVAFQLSIKPEW